MKVSAYVARFFESKGIHQFFIISGAGNVRLIDALSETPGATYACLHHEQAAVMGAIGYFRMTGKLAIPLVTAGPGATNTITGVANAFLDSTPLLVLAGQEKAEYLAATNQLRCKGVQGLDMVSVVKPLTKYAVCVQDPQDIRYHLERCLYEAFNGKPGPVWLEIPQDVQWQTIDAATLRGFDPQSMNGDEQANGIAARDRRNQHQSNLEVAAAETIKLLAAARRPLVWAGHGIRLAGAVDLFRRVLAKANVPALASWQAADIVTDDNPLFAGRAGTYGQRAGNFALQNCDLLLCLGTRLAIPQMGYSESEFAPKAKKIIVEIDPVELSKFCIPPTLGVLGDVGLFLSALEKVMVQRDGTSVLESEKTRAWRERCAAWRKNYPVCLPEYRALPKGRVNSYHFIDMLSEALHQDDSVVTDMGTSLTCTHAAIRLKQGQRLITSTGLGEMGYGLPGAIGVAFGRKRSGRIVFVGTEGSLQMNIQEMQTVIHYQLPLKIFILNNNGYLTIQHTQRALFNGRLAASSTETGVSFPDLEKLSKAYGFTYRKADDSKTIRDVIEGALSTPGPVFCEVLMPEDQFLGPKAALRVRPDGTLESPPLEDLYPFLPREELDRNMDVDVDGGAS